MAKLKQSPCRVSTAQDFSGVLPKFLGLFVRVEYVWVGQGKG